MHSGLEKFEAGVNLRVLHFPLSLIARSRSQFFHLFFAIIIVGRCCDYLLGRCGGFYSPAEAGKRVYFHWELGLTQIPPITRLPHLLPRTEELGGNYTGLKCIIRQSQN